MSQLTEVRERLLRQAYLFDEPDTYVAGVEDTLAEVSSLLDEPHGRTIDLTTTRPTMRVVNN